MRIATANAIRLCPVTSRFLTAVMVPYPYVLAAQGPCVRREARRVTSITWERPDREWPETCKFENDRLICLDF
jgi:hypothetical protein